jgi:hypothetical protein
LPFGQHISVSTLVVISKIVLVKVNYIVLFLDTLV